MSSLQFCCSLFVHSTSKISVVKDKNTIYFPTLYGLFLLCWAVCSKHTSYCVFYVMQNVCLAMQTAGCVQYICWAQQLFLHQICDYIPPHNYTQCHKITSPWSSFRSTYTLVYGMLFVCFSGVLILQGFQNKPVTNTSH